MGAKSEFLIVSPHTKEECLTALDAIAKQGKQALEHWEWACLSGDHTAYGVIEAENENAALRTLPEQLRGKAHVHKVNRFTMDEIRSFHDQQ